MKVDGSLKSLLQGMSQQPARDRLPGQCTDQLNMSSDPVSGLTRRAPTDWVDNLFSTNNLRGWHNFSTANGKKYLAGFYGNTVNVVDYAGNEQTVNVTPGLTYLNTAGELTFATIENQVVIVNRGVTVRMLNEKRSFANKGTSGSPMGIVQVLGGQYGREYRVNMDGNDIGMYKPPDGSESPMVDYVRTTMIAQRLFEAMTGTPGDVSEPDGQGSFLHRTGALAGPDWAVTRFEDVILIENNVGTSFTLTVSDDAGNVNIKSCTDTVPDIADVPRIAPAGYLLRVATETDPEEDLFIEYKREDGVTTPGSGFGQAGYWQETVSSEVNWKFNKSTMPLILDYDEDADEFTLREGQWRNRMVGTDTSNPLPSFVDSKINGVTTFQSRLVLLSRSYVCMSRTNRYEDFWMGSASSLVDTDPIDISSTAVEASVMEIAMPHNRDMVVFSQKGQFVVFGRSALTPANATLVLTTSFEAQLTARPVSVGRNIFFATKYGRFTGVREFFTEGATEINDTRPITQHVNKLIVGDAKNIAASSNYNILLVNTDQQRDIVYTYQYIWADTEKIQSSWSRWKLPDEVVHYFFDDELVYFVMTYPGSPRRYYMSKMSLDIVPEDELDFAVHLDSRFRDTGVEKVVQIPDDHLAGYDLTVVQGPGCPYPGMKSPVQSITYNGSNWEINLKYDMEGGEVHCGIPYKSMYEPTMPLVKDQDNVVIATAKLVVKKFIVSLENTGHIIGKMISKYGDGEEVKFEGRVIGSPNNLIGQPALSSEYFEMPFREQTDKGSVQFYTERYMPMTLLDIEWVGQYTKRGRRISTGGNAE